METKGNNFGYTNVLMGERNFDYNGASYPNVYVIGYDQEGKDEVHDILVSMSDDSLGPEITVNLVEESLTRSSISKEFCIAIEKIKKHMMTTKGTSVSCLMVLNPNIHSKGNVHKETVTKLMDVIGPEILVRCALVLKDGSEMYEGGSLKDHYDDVVSKKKCMCDLYDKLYPRIIAIDIGEGSQSVDDQQKKQMLSLLHATGAEFDKPVSDNYMRAACFFAGVALSSGIFLCIFLFWYLFR